MHTPTLATFLSTLVGVFCQNSSQINSPCIGTKNAPGVCIEETRCTAKGGTTINGACPNAPASIKYCSKAPCGDGGTCKFYSDCLTQNAIGGLCPGPSNFVCCLKELPAVLDLRGRVLAVTMQAKDVDYVWGSGSCSGATTGAAGGDGVGGFDCSGLVSWAICKTTGRDLFSQGLRNTEAMYCATSAELSTYTKVPYSSRAVGDLVFFGGSCNCSSTNTTIHHVGIVMEGLHTMWNAPHTGAKVRSDPIDGRPESDKPCPSVIRLA